MEYFDIPVVLFFFKREEKTVKVVNQIRKVKPKRLYLIADGPRNEEELFRTKECRRRVEQAIDWECEVVKDYAETNQGVYDRIGLGAKRVFKHEECAIFLEDDNLPDVSFFYFAKEMLEYYKDDTRVLWICGTNYLEQYQPKDGASYVYTKHMHPCGWASWGKKFVKYYDGGMTLWQTDYIKERLKKEINYRPLARHLIDKWNMVDSQIRMDGKPASWDWQMSFTQRVHNLYAVVPKYNLIENIGVDADSEHGGTSMRNKMTRRFCGIKKFSLEFPIIHPPAFLTDNEFELKTSKIITPPLNYIIKSELIKFVKRLLGKNIYKPFKEEKKRDT